MQKRRVTLKNIADEAGVSKTIVSKIVNNTSVQVGKEKRAIIEELIRRYEYTPLSSAQSLATRKTRQIAFLLSDNTTLGLANSFYGRILAGVYDTCRQRGYQCVVNVHDFSGNNEFILPDNLRRLSIDGCVLTGFFKDEYIDKLAEFDIPMIALGIEKNPQSAVPVFSRNSLKDYRQYLRYFADCHHKHIWMAQAQKADKNNFAVISPEFPDFFIELVERKSCDDEFEYGHNAALQFITMPHEQRPTLIMGSDHFCISFLSTAALHNVHCPDDFSMVCGTDTPLAQWSVPPLSVLANDVFFLGKVGTNALIDRLYGEIDKAQLTKIAADFELESHLIERASVITLEEK